ncbi:MAG: DoxX family protein [Actinobacteria bacterium]|nr:DoxX family protein [Actinomycetota bacterium]
MHRLSFPSVQRFAPVAPVILRLVVGSVMALHGWQKLTEMGPAMFGEGMVAELGIPAPVLVGWAITLVELIGGSFLVLGFLTRISAVAVTVVLLGATILVKPDLGLIAPMGSMLPGAELDLSLIAGALGVLFLGPGRPSLDHTLGIETGTPDAVRDDEPAAREPARV